MIKFLVYLSLFCTNCDGGSPSISRITPFSYNLCAVYLMSPRYTSPFCCLAREGFLTIQTKDNIISENTPLSLPLNLTLGHEKGIAEAERIVAK